VTLTGLVSAATTLGGGASAGKLDPAFGLAHRFTVEVAGLRLGSWQSCSGLRVDFKPTEAKAGGRYSSTSYLAGEVSFPKVVLKRAVDAASAGTLQRWLTDTARAWTAGRSVGGTAATITLYDSYGKAVIAWNLVNARPGAWSGPDLDAMSSKVGIETLELVHEGFTVTTGGTVEQPPSGVASPQALTLTGEVDRMVVTFPLPPTEIAVMKGQRSDNNVPIVAVGGLPASTGEGLVVNNVGNTPNVTTYGLNNLILDGAEVTKKAVDVLTWWATAQPVGSNADPTLPPLQLSWGSGFDRVGVVLQSLTASYTRFAPDGRPIRAKVGLKLEATKPLETAPPAPPPTPPPRPGSTNPTSGGRPGRSRHLVLAAETLAALAVERYDDPARWRAIAAANDVDDPLRVTPGTSLYLPAPDEPGTPPRGEVTAP
jgi:phage tail-like protein